MTIKVTGLEYDLYDVETNPNNEITAKHFELPSSLVIEQNFIDKFYGDDFDIKQDIEEAICCHTGFGVTKYTYEILPD
jgi:hypothetical protein